jgi:hypothetical protein
MCRKAQTLKTGTLVLALPSIPVRPASSLANAVSSLIPVLADSAQSLLLLRGWFRVTSRIPSSTSPPAAQPCLRRSGWAI